MHSFRENVPSAKIPRPSTKLFCFFHIHAKLLIQVFHRSFKHSVRAVAVRKTQAILIKLKNFKNFKNFNCHDLKLLGLIGFS